MEKTQNSLLGILSKRLEWLSKRQSVISENVANINTTGYVPRDLPPESFMAALHTTAPSGGLTTTAPNHLKGTLASNITGSVKVGAHDAVPTGNAVVMEEQMAKMTQNQMDYAAITNLYRKSAGMLRLALGARQ